MSIQEIIKLRNSTDEEMKVSLLLAIHCAPILLGIKAANIMTVTEQEFVQVKEVLYGTEISYCFWNTKRDKGILYLYRKQEIVKYLHLDDIQSFLKECGYDTESFNGMLECLSNRICLYSNDQIAFPHEIGVFLEYPLMDVKGFLENDGKNYICSGYWKVYTDVHNTLQKFGEYDKVRKLAVQEVVSGKKIREIVL